MVRMSGRDSRERDPREAPFYALSREEAARRVDENPEDPDAVFPIASFAEDFGLTMEEILAEMRSGALVAEGQRREGGYSNVCITYKNAVRWLASGGKVSNRALLTLSHPSPAPRPLK